MFYLGPACPEPDLGRPIGEQFPHFRVYLKAHPNAPTGLLNTCSCQPSAFLVVDRMRNIDLNIFPEILIAMVSDRVGDHADDWTKIVVETVTSNFLVLARPDVGYL
jgi:hypothetical protein